MRTRASIYYRHRFPGDVIRHGVWLYYPFCLSYRDVEDLPAERGIRVSYETVRRWCIRFGPLYANRLSKRCGPVGDQWFVDEVFFGSTDDCITCFERLIRMGKSWMSWSRNGGTRPPRRGFFAGFSSNSAERLGGSSPTSSDATPARPRSGGRSRTPLLRGGSRAPSRGGSFGVWAIYLRSSQGQGITLDDQPVNTEARHRVASRCGFRTVGGDCARRGQFRGRSNGD